jgi:DNA-binding NtrC family response regulator
LLLVESGTDEPLLVPDDFLILDASQFVHALTMQLPADGVEIERVVDDLVRQAFERAGGNQSRGARLVGWSRDQFRYRLEKLGLLAGQDGHFG